MLCKIMVANCGSKFLKINANFIFIVVYLIFFFILDWEFDKIHESSSSKESNSESTFNGLWL